MSPFAFNQQNLREVSLPVELGSLSFTGLSGTTPCPSRHTTFWFLLYASFTPSSVSVSFYCPSVTRDDSKVCLLHTSTCAGCPATWAIAMFLLQPFP